MPNLQHWETWLTTFASSLCLDNEEDRSVLAMKLAEAGVEAPRSCDTCIYWRPGASAGQCRAMAPRTDGASEFAKWPVTQWSDSCGDYEPK